MKKKKPKHRRVSLDYFHFFDYQSIHCNWGIGFSMCDIHSLEIGYVLLRCQSFIKMRDRHTHTTTTKPENCNTRAISNETCNCLPELHCSYSLIFSFSALSPFIFDASVSCMQMDLNTLCFATYKHSCGFHRSIV